MADDETKDEAVKEAAVETPKVAEEAAPEKEAEAPAEVKEEPKKEEPKETPKEEPKEPSVEISKDAQKILDMVEKLSVLELADLVKAMEEKFGVSAAAPVMAIAGGGAAGGGDDADAEPSTVDVVLASVGGQKIAVIKAVREITGLGLKEAKDLVDAAPKAVKEGLSKDEAEKIKADLEATGATVELK